MRARYRRRAIQAAHLTIATALAGLFSLRCGGSSSELSSLEDPEPLASCALVVTQNDYDGPNYWGTMKIKNTGPTAVKGYTVTFDVPSSARCTFDTVPWGATMRTQANHCKLVWSNATLASGASTTFHYSTTSTTFSAARNVVVGSARCGGGDAGAAQDSGVEIDASSGGEAGHPDGGARRIDLSGWELQLPTGPAGQPDTVTSLDGYSSIYFHEDATGSVTFMDPTTGTATSGSLHPRSELREVTSGWSATRTNRLTVIAQVTQVPSKVTIGQIFQAPSAPSKPLLELEYNKGGRITLLLESTNQGGSANIYDVGTVADGARFTYQLSLSGGVIAIDINGKVSTFGLPSTFEGESFYFKCGDYDQTATQGSPGATPGTVVRFDDVAVVHQ